MKTSTVFLSSCSALVQHCLIGVNYALRKVHYILSNRISQCSCSRSTTDRNEYHIDSFVPSRWNLTHSCYKGERIKIQLTNALIFYEYLSWSTFSFGSLLMVVFEWQSQVDPDCHLSTKCWICPINAFCQCIYSMNTLS